MICEKYQLTKFKKKIQKKYNFSSIIVTLMNTSMFVLNNIFNFEALMRKSVFAFTTRLTNSENAIICTIQSSWVIWKVWTDKLYII